MSNTYQEYETAALRLKFVEKQIELRAQEGNKPEVTKLVSKKEQLVAICDDLYCQVFMQKTG